MQKNIPHLYERRRRQIRKSLVIVASVFGAVIMSFAILIGVWWLMMPPSVEKDATEEITNTQQMIAEQIKSDVEYLANTIGERNMDTPGSLERSLDFLEERFTSIGYTPEFQHYSLQRGHYSGRSATNISTEIPGSEKRDELIIIGAHYDSVPHSPGANDNASGVAVLLSLAEKMAGTNPDRTIRFVSFVNEEPPFFQTKDMGSYAYAKQSRERDENIIAMIALDGLGYFDDTPGSQNYPLPGLGIAYPTQAEFIGLVTRLGDLNLLKKVAAGFKESNSIPTQSAALPGFLPGVGWSDHWSFWQHNYPGVLVTDTLPFRDPYYHTASDTPERLNYENMARIATSLYESIMILDSE